MTAETDGGVAITLAGKTFTMTPSFQAIVEIEQHTDKGLLELMAYLIDGRGKITDSAAVITAGLKAAGEPATVDKVGAMLFESGAKSFMRPVLTYLATLLNGGRPLAEADETENPARS